MTWADWLIVGWLTFGSLAAVAIIGKPRRPLDPSTAVVTLLLNGAFILCLLWSHGALG